MDRYTKLFESNMLVTNDCPIIVEKYTIKKDVTNNGIFLETQFRNVSMKSIMAIEIAVVCFDVMGNELGVLPSFIYQDAIISPNQSYGENLVIMLKDPNTRVVDIVCKRVVFVDRVIWQNENEEPFREAPEAENLLQDMDQEIATQLTNYELNYVGLRPNYLLKPVSLGKLRRCVCGAFNYDNEQRCLGCNQSVRFWEDITDTDFLKKRSDERIKQEEQQKAEAEKQRIEQEKQLEEERKIKEEKKKKRMKRFTRVGIPIIIAVILVAAALCSAFFYFIPKAHYEKGVEYMENREFKKASDEFKGAGQFVSDREVNEANLLSEVEPYEKKLEGYFDKCCKLEDISKICLFPRAGRSVYYNNLSTTDNAACVDTLHNYAKSAADISAYHYYNAKYYLLVRLSPKLAWIEINKVVDTKAFKDFDEVKKTIHDAVYWNGVRIHLTRAHLYDASRTLDLLIIKNDTYKAMKNYFKQHAIVKDKTKYTYFVCDANEKSAVGVETSRPIGTYTGIKDKVKTQ